MISNISELSKIIGNTLLRQSGLERSRILNATTIKGADLSNFVLNNVKLSYNLDDLVIIFNIDLLASDSIDITQTIDNNIIESISVGVKVIIYGKMSVDLAKTLTARFESEKVRNDLLDKGIHLISIDSMTSTKEFMNEIVWPRTEFLLHIAYETKIDKVDDYEYITSIEDISYTASKK